MIKIEETETYGWEAAIRGMRNPMNSWDKSDSKVCSEYDVGEFCDCWNGGSAACPYYDTCLDGSWVNDYQMLHLGKKDADLMGRLCAAGTDHRKFMRMLTVSCDITAPLYWWKEFDTYKVGTVANSCSTMHKIHAKEFTIDDFSHEHLIEESDDFEVGVWWGTDGVNRIEPKDILETIIESLNACHEAYVKTKDKKYWWQMIQLLPSSYNQKRTVMMNYEVLTNIYNSRKNHKLDEWHDFCDWIKTLPYSDFITGMADATDFYRKAFRSCFEPTDEPIARAILTGEQIPEAKVVYKDALSEK